MLRQENSRRLSKRFLPGRSDLSVAVDHLYEEPDLQPDDGHVHHDLWHDGRRASGGCGQEAQTPQQETGCTGGEDETAEDLIFSVKFWFNTQILQVSGGSLV